MSGRAVFVACWVSLLAAACAAFWIMRQEVPTGAEACMRACGIRHQAEWTAGIPEHNEKRGDYLTYGMTHVEAVPEKCMCWGNP